MQILFYVTLLPTKKYPNIIIDISLYKKIFLNIFLLLSLISQCYSCRPLGK